MLKGVKKMKNSRILCALIGIMLFVSVGGFSIQRFTVVGDVIDPQTCEGIPEVKIIMHHIENGISVELFSEENGYFIKHFTIIGNITIHAEKAGYIPYDGRIYARLGDNRMIIPLMKENKPITQVCQKIENSPFGQYLKSLITEIPEIPEEKGLGEKYDSAKGSIAIQDYASAIISLLEEEKINPNNFAVNFYLGLCYFESDKIDEAIARWTKANEIAPSRVIVLKNLAKAWEKKGDRVKAAEYMQKYADEIVKIETTKPEDKKAAYHNAGIYWYNANMADKYYAAFSKVVELDPTNGDAWFYIGMYYFAAQKNKECVEAMEKALASTTISEDNKQTAIAIRDAAKSVM
jgi:tetratricopeptide (TPR) repeat protein